MKECWVLWQAFSAFNEMILCFFSVCLNGGLHYRCTFVELSSSLWEDNLIMVGDILCTLGFDLQAFYKLTKKCYRN